MLNYDDDDCAQFYAQIKEASRALTKDDIFNHIYQMMFSDPQVSELMMLVIIFMFSIYDIRKISQLLNR